MMVTAMMIQTIFYHLSVTEIFKLV